jgi:hypothetical protein
VPPLRSSACPFATVLMHVGDNTPAAVPQGRCRRRCRGPRPGPVS